jgi:excisionase family DNA binding protein
MTIDDCGPRLMTPAEVARAIGVVSPRTIASEVRRGRIRSTRLGGRVYIPATEVQRILAGDGSGGAL